jgi:hypothetical protein
MIPEHATWVRFPRFVGDDGAPSAIARRSRSGSGRTGLDVLSDRGVVRASPDTMIQEGRLDP